MNRILVHNDLVISQKARCSYDLNNQALIPYHREVILHGTYLSTVLLMKIKGNVCSRPLSSRRWTTCRRRPVRRLLFHFLWFNEIVISNFILIFLIIAENDGFIRSFIRHTNIRQQFTYPFGLIIICGIFFLIILRFLRLFKLLFHFFSI